MPRPKGNHPDALDRRILELLIEGHTPKEIAPLVRLRNIGARLEVLRDVYYVTTNEALVVRYDREQRKP